MLSWLFPSLLAKGSVAPGFALLDQAGVEVKLETLRGHNVVLVFYPADNTSVCTKQLCEFRDTWAYVQQKNTLVFGVNPGSQASHAKFRKHYDLPFPILVDAGQKVASLYHARGIVPRRTVYLIGPDGLIRFAQRGKPSPQEVLAAAA